MSGKKVIVVMPAYNAAKTLEKTLAILPRTSYDEIILVDDASKDDTVSIARSLGDTYPITIQALSENRGYGGNQKECYRLALERGADVIVLLHPDLQYDPALVPQLVEPIIAGTHDVMIGSRIRSMSDARTGGMPLYKYLTNRFLTSIQNAVSGRKLSEWHTGMRAYSKDALSRVRYESFSSHFLFDTQMLFGIVREGYSIGEIPVPVRYDPDSSSISFANSLRYGIGTLGECGKHIGIRCYTTFMKDRPFSRLGFTLIELLVVIAIIATLSSIVLSSLNSARNKGIDASIKENLHNVRAAAALDYDGNNNSYGTTAWVANATTFTPGTGVPGATTMFNDRTIGAMLLQVAQAGGALSYASNNVSWIIISKLKGTGYWCIDSNGTAVAEVGMYDAPTTVYNYGGSMATTLTCK